MALFRRYYVYEQIKGSLRETIFLIPEDAFREAIANALVHRTWDVAAHINIGMFSDRIQITSPGGLPEGIRESDYLRGGVSILRNPIIANVFFRLQIIEKFGTGIRRINDAYRGSLIQPTFTVSENAISLTLPVLQKKTICILTVRRYMPC